MNKLLLAATTLICVPAFAQAPPPPPAIAMPGAAMGRTEVRSEVAARTQQIFTALDTNHDGVLDQGELDNAGARYPGGVSGGGTAPAARMPLDRNAQFDLIDTNHDGMISRDEFARAGMTAPSAVAGGGGGGRRGGGGLGRGLANADTNHDGKVTLAEATAFMLQRFDRQDLNHDGQITPDERAAYRAQMQQMRGQ